MIWCLVFVDTKTPFVTEIRLDEMSSRLLVLSIFAILYIVF